MKLRKIQSDFKEPIIDIIKGVPIEKIIVAGTPGAGKSSLPIILTDLIKYRRIHKIAWVVPRSALQDQGERGFLDPFFREMFDHNYQIRSSTNENDPSRGTNGFITTYQALGADKKNTAIKEFNKWEYALVLDEYHHIEEGKPWHKYIKFLASKAKYLILMSGTLGRNNGSKIAFTDYDQNGYPILKNTDTTRVINYTRTDALKEKAILPIQFFFSDAKLEWINENRTNVKIKSFKNVKYAKDISDALFTALHSDFATDLIQKCLAHWIDHRKTNPTAKMLVVTDGKINARKLNKYLQKLNFNSHIAISHEPNEAKSAIKRFKRSGLDILVTIAMAYEGMDVPEISHIAALTHIRSKEWLEQLFARGARINNRINYGEQSCFVFAPSDKKILSVAKKIEAEQLTQLSYKPEPKPFDCSEKCKNTGTILCATCEYPEHYEEWEGVPLEIRGVTPLMGELIGTNHFNIGEHNRLETPSEKEAKVKKELSDYIAKCCKGSAENITDVNRDLKSLFGKPRKDCNLRELEKLLIHAKKNYSDLVPGTTIKKGITEYNPKNNRGVWDGYN